MSSDDNITYLNQITTLDIPVERVISGASEAKLTEVIILGFTEEGEEYFASSKAGGPDALWLLARMQYNLFQAADEYSGE